MALPVMTPLLPFTCFLIRSLFACPLILATLHEEHYHADNLSPSRNAENDLDGSAFQRDSTITSEHSPTSEDEEHLSLDMFKGYNPLIRPSPCHHNQAAATHVDVEFGMSMILLISVDERNQIMQTNVWLTLKWNDCQFSWDPRNYGGLKSMRVPVDRVWTPDIVLFNNADGNYEVTYQSNALVDHMGNVTWVPPAIYKSSCRIDVEYFPFDEQTCHLVFGSWTYTAEEVKLKWYNGRSSVEFSDYSPSGVWDIIDGPGELVANRSKISFQIVIRRKTLFYSVILLIPTVLMAFLSMLVFYLPADCSEKITLAISILLALVVFLLLVSKILPPNSDTIPLMANYLLLTFILNIATIMATVIIINIYFRNVTTHRMPNCVRYFFLKLLPTLLMMRRPERIPLYNGYFVEEYEVEEIFDASLIMPSIAATVLPFSQLAFRSNITTTFGARPQTTFSVDQQPQATYSTSQQEAIERGGRPREGQPSSAHAEREDGKQPYAQAQLSSKELFSGEHTFGPTRFTSLNEALQTRPGYAHEQHVSEELKSAVESIAYIAEHVKAETSDKRVRDDWKYISMVMDRLLLLTFFGVTLGGTIRIILYAPHAFDFVDQYEVLRKLISEGRAQSGDI